MQKILKLREAIKTDHFPFAESKLRSLIHNGELKKQGKLPEGKDYVLGLNFGSPRWPRWYVDIDELHRWRMERTKSIINSL